MAEAPEQFELAIGDDVRDFALSFPDSSFLLLAPKKVAATFDWQGPPLLGSHGRFENVAGFVHGRQDVLIVRGLLH